MRKLFIEIDHVTHQVTDIKKVWHESDAETTYYELMDGQEYEVTDEKGFEYVKIKTELLGYYQE